MRRFMSYLAVTAMMVAATLVIEILLGGSFGVIDFLLTATTVFLLAQVYRHALSVEEKTAVRAHFQHTWPAYMLVGSTLSGFAFMLLGGWVAFLPENQRGGRLDGVFLGIALSFMLTGIALANLNRTPKVLSDPNHSQPLNC